MKRLFLAVLAAAFALPVLAQQYPSRPVRILVGFAPGGGVDISARLLASKLAEYLGQQFVVENKPGAGTNIAAAEAAKAAPDGYTLFMNSPAVVINTALYAKPPYQLSDFVGVSNFAATTNLLVVPATVEAKTVQELVKLAKDKPGALNYSSAGPGTTQHLAGELFKLRTGTDIVHVPYKGSGPSMTALLASEVQLSFINPVAAGGHVKAGKLRALAVTDSRRTELMPEVPTMKEAGVEGVEVSLWYGLLAPAATPKDIVDKLGAAVARAANDPAVRDVLRKQGADPIGNTPAQFNAYLKAEQGRWSEVVKVSGARVE
ncbi:MAG TPA: tripartite tricarboxylate transporter substrate binding protein [Burkholderiales bacterium]|nr:tripartite tricarboxylate transporter substrate binding protein [Burkholderiales bacterium]